MRKIILASRSKARKNLLKELGVKFEVAYSSAKEDKVPVGGRVEKLVVKNALRKAAGVAERFNSGVVIGADTLVLAGKKVIGKPKSLKDAFNTLRFLSKKPQWVYTGLAVIDVDNGKAFTDYEKTKVYVYRLTDREIRNYFKRTSPLDKAGSFDIQGLGGIFIERIEGCFYNVVGLPLAKLAKLLKKTRVDIF